MSLCVCVYSKQLDGSSDRADFNFLSRRLLSTYPTLCYQKIRVSPKQGSFPLELCPKLWTLKILPWHVDRRKYVVNLVRQRCDKLGTVVGQTKLTVLATVDVVRQTTLASSSQWASTTTTYSTMRVVRQRVARVYLQQLILLVLESCRDSPVRRGRWLLAEEYAAWTHRSHTPVWLVRHICCATTKHSHLYFFSLLVSSEMDVGPFFFTQPNPTIIHLREMQTPVL